MKFFICLLDPDGRGALDSARAAFESLPRARGLMFVWQSAGSAAVLTASDDSSADPLVVQQGDYLAVGTVRIDNRADLERWSECAGQNVGDLELVLRTVRHHGTRYVSQFLGDFAFVVWNATTRTAVAACDAFALKKLYYVDRRGVFAFASRAEALALDDNYDIQYLAERAAGCYPSPEVAVYARVRTVPASTIAVLERGRIAMRKFWSPDDFEPDSSSRPSESEAAGICRDLLIESVRLRLGSGEQTWAQLSGGLDSSAVVSVAQWMVEHGRSRSGLAGTITYVDRQGTGADEREYSDTVVSRWRLCNTVIVDPPFWYDRNCAVPRTDLPTPALPFYPREHRLCAIVRRAGGRILLTGMGGDELFTGTMLFFADEVARFRIWSALREMARRAAMGRVSFWDLAYRNALLPFFPQAIQNHVGRDSGRVPPWVRQTIIKQYGLQKRAYLASNYAGRIGHKAHHAIAFNLMGFGSTGDYPVISDVLDVRHPFFYRPLVEFALRLRPELCVRPHARKWILREAMRGILPEPVRTRIGKGTPVERYVSSFTTQRPLLEPLVQKPILSELGIVDAVKLRSAFDAVPRQPSRRDDQHGDLHSTLVIEAWLQMRSGRWPHGGSFDVARSTRAGSCPSD